MIVQRALADADRGGDGIDPDRTDALQIEQPVGGFENPLFMAGFWGRDIFAQTCVAVPLTAAAVPMLITQVGVIKSVRQAARGFRVAGTGTRTMPLLQLLRPACQF